MKKMEVTIQTKTPLWTGDAKRESKILRETSIIGSLRWWYEGLIRGLGGYACSPTAQEKNPCKFDTSKYQKDKTQLDSLLLKLCPACLLFGCTGWSRKFKLVLSSDFCKSSTDILTRKNNHNRPIGGLHNIKDQTIKLNLTGLKSIDDVECFLLSKTFELLKKYGALGARTSQGNGVFIIKENSFKNIPSATQEIKEFITNQKPREDSKNNLQHFNLKNSLFSEYTITFTEDISSLITKHTFFDKKYDDKLDIYKCQTQKWENIWTEFEYLPIAPLIRDAIRRCIANTTKRHKVFGYVQGGDIQSSLVKISHGIKVTDTDTSVIVRCHFMNGTSKKTEIKKAIMNKTEIEKSLKCINSKTSGFVSGIEETQTHNGSEIIENIKIGKDI
ncbi:MAG: type III-B CRISPR module RAMP protein Cmr1 [Bacteroidota bacterium]